MVWNTNLGQWFGGGTRFRELEDTRRAWQETDVLWKASPLGQTSTTDRVWAFIRPLLERRERTPAYPISLAILEATDQLFTAEHAGQIEPLWSYIEGDAEIAVRFRRVLEQRRRYATEFTHIHGIITRQIGTAWGVFLDALPELCFDEWPEGGSAIEVPLVDLLEDPAAVIEGIFLAAYDDEVLHLNLLTSLRERYVTNLLVASGFAPTVDPHEVNDRLVLPSGQKVKSAAELVDMYLGGTPFAALMEIPVPLHIPDEVRFEHAHILGGTGHGKTQLLQRMIHADLLAAKDDGRSVVVIDSQGDLINKLVRLDLFDPHTPGSLASRLVLIDPSDIENPPALNLFDAHLDRISDYRPVDRERVLNGVVELYENMFGNMLGAELTAKQGVVFRYLARLMVTIPGATIHTLMKLMEDGRPFKPHMERLEGSARYFFESEFFHPSFAATKKQILRRLWGVLSTPTFERMFAQPTNKIDVFEATKEGRIILVSTAKELLKTDGSALLGRFFINLLAQAALERSVLPEHERTPTFVYVDEAQEYFDDGVETILQQARKYRISLLAAHQSLDQASPRLRSALFANTSFKCAGGVSSKDARALADELRTTPDFIEGMKRRRDRSEFAAWIKNWTPQAIRLSVPLGFLERQPTLSEEAYDELLEGNRARYCGLAHLSAAPREAAHQSEADDGQSVGEERSAEPAEPTPEREALVVEPVEQAESSPRRPPTPAPVRELGKGGAKHRYLQNLVKGLAEQQGFKATIEAPVAGGQVDVLLEREGLRVAVEVSVTTPVEWERQSLARCLAAGCPHVVLVLAKSQQTAKRYRDAVVEGLDEEARSRLTLLYPDDLPDFIASLGEPTAPEENIVKGYRVRVSRTEVSPGEAQARRDTLARLVAQSLRRDPD